MRLNGEVEWILDKLGCVMRLLMCRRAVGQSSGGCTSARPLMEKSQQQQRLWAPPALSAHPLLTGTQSGRQSSARSCCLSTSESTVCIAVLPTRWGPSFLCFLACAVSPCCAQLFLARLCTCPGGAFVSTACSCCIVAPLIYSIVRSILHQTQ